MAQYCRTCGKQVSERNKFCPGCGTQLHPHAQAPEQPVQPIRPPAPPAGPPIRAEQPSAQPVQEPAQPIRPPAQPVQPHQASLRQPAQADLHAKYTYVAPPQSVIREIPTEESRPVKKHTGAIISVAAVAVLAALALIVTILRPWDDQKSKTDSKDDNPTVVQEETELTPDETVRTPEETILLLFEAMKTGSETKLRESICTFLMENKFSGDLQKTLKEMKDGFVATYGQNAQIRVSCEETERLQTEELEAVLKEDFGFSPADYGITEMICMECEIAIGSDVLDTTILLVRENEVWKVLDLDD